MSLHQVKETVTKFPLKCKSKGSKCYQRLQGDCRAPISGFQNRLGQVPAMTYPWLCLMARGRTPWPLKTPTQHYDYTISQVPGAILAPQLLFSFIFLPCFKIPPSQRNFACFHFLSSLPRHNAYNFGQAFFLLHSSTTFLMCLLLNSASNSTV